MAEVFDLTGKVRVDLSGLDKATASTKQAAQTMERGLEGAAASTKDLDKATQQTVGSLGKLRQEQEKTQKTAATLQLATRNLATEMLGNSTAAVALGTVIGGILGAALMQAAQSIISFMGEASRLRNELATIAPLATNVGRAFAFVQEQAQISGRALEVVSTEYAQLSRAAQQAGVAQEEVNKFFEDWNRFLQASQVPTLTNSLSRLGSAAGGFLSQLSNAIGLTSILTNAAEGFGRLANMIGMAMPATRSEIEKLANGAQHFNEIIRGLTSRSMSLAEAIGRLDIPRGMFSTNEDVARAEALRIAENSRLDVLTRINNLLSIDPMIRLQAIISQRNLNLQLEHELQVAGMNRNEHEIMNRLFQIRMQFLQMGLVLNDQQLNNYRAQLVEIQRITLAQRDIAAHAQGMVTALSGVPVMFGNIFTTSGLDTLRGGFNSFTEELTTFHTQAFQDAGLVMEASMRHAGATAQEIFNMRRGLLMQEQRLTMDTAQKVGQALTAVFPKSKAAAIGQAVINTAVGITQALGLPWPFNWIQAAAVAASGAAQIASIRSASPSGGSTPTVGGGGANTGAEAGGSMPQMITIEMERGQLFSSEQVNNLMALISEEVKNGGALIATRLT